MRLSGPSTIRIVGRSGFGANRERAGSAASLSVGMVKRKAELPVGCGGALEGNIVERTVDWYGSSVWGGHLGKGEGERGYVDSVSANNKVPVGYDRSPWPTDLERAFFGVDADDHM